MSQDPAMGAIIEREEAILAQFGAEKCHGVLRELRDEMLRTNRSARPFSIALFRFDPISGAQKSSQESMRRKILMAIQSRAAERLRPTDRSGVSAPTSYLCVLPETSLDGAWVAASRVISGGGVIGLISKASKMFCDFRAGCAQFNAEDHCARSIISAAECATRRLTEHGLVEEDASAA